MTWIDLNATTPVTTFLTGKKASNTFTLHRNVYTQPYPVNKYEQ